MVTDGFQQYYAPILERPLSTSPSGHLNIDGIDAMQLADSYGTPLFVFMEDVIRDSYRRFATALSSAYSRSRVFYACKANGLLSILSILRCYGRL